MKANDSDRLPQTDRPGKPDSDRIEKARIMLDEAIDMAQAATDNINESKFYLYDSESEYRLMPNRSEREEHEERLEDMEKWLLDAIIQVAASIDRLAYCAHYIGLGYPEFDADLIDSAAQITGTALLQSLSRQAAKDPRLKIAKDESGNSIKAWRDPAAGESRFMDYAINGGFTADGRLEMTEIWPYLFWPDLLTPGGAPNGGPLLRFPIGSAGKERNVETAERQAERAELLVAAHRYTLKSYEWEAEWE